MTTSKSFKAFEHYCFTKLGADWIQGQYDGDVKVSAIAVNQRVPKVVAVWVKDKGLVYEDKS